MSKNPIIDITIIGGGPTGCSPPFMRGCARFRKSDREHAPAWRPTLALYPEKYIYDVAGFPKVRAQELINNLIEQAKTADPIYCLDEKVLKVEKRVRRHLRTRPPPNGSTSPGRSSSRPDAAPSNRANRAARSGTLRRKRALLFCQRHAAVCRKNVLIAGGGDSAVDWALMLEPIAESVTLIHRRDRFRAHEHSVQQMMNSSIRVITPREIQSIHGDDADRKSGDREQTIR